MEKELTVEQVEEFHNFLSSGEQPEGMQVGRPPKVGKKVAFTIIWYLQEHLRIIPDNFEMCDRCLRIYDSWGEGIYLEGRKRINHVCGNCITNADDKLFDKENN